MKKLLRAAGFIMAFGSGALMWLFWIGALSQWLGLFGVIIGVLFTPGAVVFPILFWIVKGVFPTMYFALWGVGLLGMVVANLSD
jgi:hypothetical protein